jgi:CRP-like cAMP-binding protein
MIDRIRSQIQERLDQLLAEADKLRHALSALDPRDHSPATPASSRPRTTKARTTARSTRSAAPAAATKTDGAARARTAPGATKRAVLAALNSDKALTAGEVAAATGLARPTVSTTLSKLATSGEIRKAERGYQLPGNSKTAGADAAAVK